MANMGVRHCLAASGSLGADARYEAVDRPTADGEANGKTQFGVQSVEIGLRVLAVLAAAHRPLMLRELAKVLAMPASKVHRYLVSLTRAGMVEQHGAGGRYGLGPLALSIGLAALHQLDVVRVAGTAVADLRDRIDQTALLAIWGTAGPTIVRWEECRRPLTVNTRVGSVLRLLDSATGLVFAALLPRHLTEANIAEEMREEHHREEVEALLADVRRRGLSRVRGNQMASINAFGAPIFDHTGSLAGAISVLGPEGSFNSDWNGPVARELKAVASQVSERLGLGEGGEACEQGNGAPGGSV